MSYKKRSGAIQDRHRLNGYLAQRVPSFYELFKLCSSERYVSLED